MMKGGGSNQEDGDEYLYSELWRTCSGPLASVPHAGEKVFYFPQGHIQQIEAYTSCDGDQKLPTCNLPSKILCRVVHVELKVERDTDEVFAQLTLVPEFEGERTTSKEEALQPSNSRECVVSFSKTLTASDTSPHGGFSVLKRHADECLPQLDMTRSPPSQELVAKDLHGTEWRFRHIYRGQPKRHLLTTGWSTFVSLKKLVAGDAFILLRGESGKLRVGVRRAMKPQNIASPSVLSAQSMQLGLIASAGHAIRTGTMFSVYYWPRRSPYKFIVPFDQYAESIKNNYSIGLRFQMMVEGQEGQEERCVGTVTSIEDVEPASWPFSKWKCLKVKWDETVGGGRADRVSPWDVVPFQAPKPHPHALSRPKRQRGGGCHLPAANESSSRHNDGSSVFFTKPAAGHQEILHGGQENLARGPSFHVDPNDIGNNKHMLLSSQWIPPPIIDPERGYDHYIDKQRLMGAEKWSSSLQHELCQENNSRNLGNPWVPSHWLQDISTYNALPTPHINPSWFQESEVNRMHKATVDSAGAQTIGPSSCILPVTSDNTNDIQKVEFPKSKETVGWKEGQPFKLFGVNLVEIPLDHIPTSDDIHQPSTRNFSDPSRTAKPSESWGSGSINAHSSSLFHPATPRSCTKVQKQGCALGRSVDLSKFDSYEKLIDELDRMFEFGGGLQDCSKGWKVVYTDNEGDFMLVGDCSWPVFCSTVRKICIYPQEEVKTLTAGR